MASEEAGIAAVAGFSAVAAILADAASDMGTLAAIITAMPIVLEQAAGVVDAIRGDTSAEQIITSLKYARERADEAMCAAHEQVDAPRWEIQGRLAGVMEGADPTMLIGALDEMGSRLDDMTIAIADTGKLIKREVRRARSLGARSR